MKRKSVMILAAVTCAMLALSACGGYSAVKVSGTPDASFAVVGNGGMSVQQDKYVYFVNGYSTEDVTDTNEWGAAVRGGIYRIELADTASASTEVVTMTTDESKFSQSGYAVDPYQGYYGEYKTRLAADVTPVDDGADSVTAFKMHSVKDYDGNDDAQIDATCIAPKKVVDGNGDAVGGGFTQMAADFLQCRSLADRKIRDLTRGQREVWHQVVKTDDLRAALQCGRQVVCHGAVCAEKGNLVYRLSAVLGQRPQSRVIKKLPGKPLHLAAGSCHIHLRKNGPAVFAPESAVGGFQFEENGFIAQQDEDFLNQQIRHKMVRQNGIPVHNASAGAENASVEANLHDGIRDTVRCPSGAEEDLVTVGSCAPNGIHGCGTWFRSGVGKGAIDIKKQ